MTPTALLSHALSNDVDFEKLCIALLTKIATDDSPTYAEAMAGPYSKEFKIAIAQEYRSLAENDVFSEPCLLPKGKTALGTKMVLKLKESESEAIPKKFKARLCGKGYRQQYGIDYFETFAPVAAYNSLRIFITLMLSLDYENDAVDVITAFLLSPLQEDIYIKIPDGYPTQTGNEGKVLKLLKNLYGLKQAPLAWNQELDKHLQTLGFNATQSERCVYVRKWKNTVAYILVYVDDLLLACSNRKEMAELKSKINSKFPITDKGPISFFLNMHFIRDRILHTMIIHQETKIKKLLSDSRLTKKDREFISKPSRTPALSDKILSKDMCPTDDTEKARMACYPYKSILGQLLYIAITARPDIVPAVSAAGRFAHNPGREHWQALLQIMKY
jgi:hypothetical protein